MEKGPRRRPGVARRLSHEEHILLLLEFLPTLRWLLDYDVEL